LGKLGKVRANTSKLSSKLMHKSKGDDAIKAVGKSKSGMMSLFDEEFY